MTEQQPKTDGSPFGEAYCSVLTDANRFTDFERGEDLVLADFAADLEIALRRLHTAVCLRMMPEEPSGKTRMELLSAWKEAGELLSQNVECRNRAGEIS